MTHFRILLKRFNFMNTLNKRFSLVIIRRSWNFTAFNDVYCIFLNKRMISRLSGKLSKPLIGRFFLARNVLRFLLQLRNWTSVCKECQMFCRRKLPKCQVQFWKKRSNGPQQELALTARFDFFVILIVGTISNYWRILAKKHIFC